MFAYIFKSLKYLSIELHKDLTDHGYMATLSIEEV